MNLGFIGTGTIATAVVHALAPLGHKIAVSERSASNATALNAAYSNVSVADNAGVTAVADVLFLGLMPDTAREALPALPFRKGQRIISFIADLPLTDVQALVAPAQAVSLVLPFPAIEHTRSPLVAFPHSDLVTEIFAAHDVFAMESEAEFNAILAAQAVLSPVVQMLLTASDWAATQGADATKTQDFLRSLIASNLSASQLTPLLQSLGTTGGYNARLHSHMSEAGSFTALSRGLSAL
ncbi:NAD(P)-binding domain-containing protein [Lentibacter sp. XHP0401]|uniref:NAD(P)-binding domain-containing protein n=1 Tax=Lentibacter sp. XHP0401 TaxID=2984334 RepID=UPI0021E6FD4E|nr:NAD(P)-binding domain-containing protein [Lentibacter sp. XHP0401]MCV2893520.1 NAD(P)-binding domain-containing protein [Lentibacter sp. XHP0401]